MEETTQLTLTVPEGWHEVTIGQWSRMDLSDPVSIVTTLCNLTKEDLWQVSAEGLEDLIKALDFVRYPVSPRVRDTVGDNEKVSITGINVRSLQRLEVLVEDFKGNAAEIAQVLYQTEEDLSNRVSVQDLYGAVVHLTLTVGLLFSDPWNQGEQDNTLDS